MSATDQNNHFETRGIEFILPAASEREVAIRQMKAFIDTHGLSDCVDISQGADSGPAIFKLKEEYRKQWAPEWNTNRLYASIKGFILTMIC